MDLIYFTMGVAPVFGVEFNRSDGNAQVFGGGWCLDLLRSPVDSQTDNLSPWGGPAGQVLVLPGENTFGLILKDVL